MLRLCQLRVIESQSRQSPVTSFAGQDARRWFTSEESPTVILETAVEKRSSFLLVVLGEGEREFCMRSCFNSLRDSFSALRPETYLRRASTAKTIALQATVDFPIFSRIPGGYLVLAESVEKVSHLFLQIDGTRLRVRSLSGHWLMEGSAESLCWRCFMQRRKSRRGNCVLVKRGVEGAGKKKLKHQKGGDV